MLAGRVLSLLHVPGLLGDLHADESRYGPSFDLMKKTVTLGNVSEVKLGSSSWLENLWTFGGILCQLPRACCPATLWCVPGGGGSRERGYTWVCPVVHLYSLTGSVSVCLCVCVL